MNIKQIISVGLLFGFIYYLAFKFLDSLPNFADRSLIIFFAIVVVLILVLLIVRLLNY